MAKGNSAGSVGKLRRIKRKKPRKRKLRKSSKATTTELYRYPRHTDIEVIVDLDNPKRVVLIPFPPDESLSQKIADWLLDKFGGSTIDRDLLISMTIEARKKFCELRGINVKHNILDDSDTEDEVEEDLSPSMAELEFYMNG